MPREETINLRLGHSPDPDDAFMWWPVTPPPDDAGTGSGSPMDTGRFRFQPVVEDIESLNRRSASVAPRWRDGDADGQSPPGGGPSARGPLEITAMSCANYPRVREHYVLTACGASLGDQYGPKIVARRPMTVEELRRSCLRGDIVIAVPGRLTSAFAATALLLERPDFPSEEVAFDRILDAVAQGRCEAGLVIHEGQLTYEQHGLHLVADIGQWWAERTSAPANPPGASPRGLPLPLGVNAVRADLDERYGPGTIREVTAVLRRSIEFAVAHRREALAFALNFARGMSADLADRFVDLYVNRWTLDFGPDGREAVERFLAEIHRIGLIERAEPVEFV